MLSIYYGEMNEAIYNTSVYFKNTFRNEWLEDLNNPGGITPPVRA